MKVIFATSNLNKLKEVRAIIPSCLIEFITLRELGDNDDVVEDGKTFEENAYIKAKHFFDKYNMPIMAEDSGICCSGLDGKPGIFSARYSGKGSKENNKKLIKELVGKPKYAYYYCAICYIDVNGKAHYFNGQTNGVIIEEERGTNGFGYDPIFKSDELGVTFGEATEEAKNQISHRNRALTKFYNYLKHENNN